jgi:hypothetical protein
MSNLAMPIHVPTDPPAKAEPYVFNVRVRERFAMKRRTFLLNSARALPSWASASGQFVMKINLGIFGSYMHVSMSRHKILRIVKVEDFSLFSACPLHPANLAF